MHQLLLPRYVRNMGRSNLVVGVALTLLLGGAFAQESCVKVSDVSYTATCPCDSGSDFSFKMEGATTFAENTVSGEWNLLVAPFVGRSGGGPLFFL